MIKESMNVSSDGNADGIAEYDGLPFLLSPALKDYLWGGTRLSEEYGKGKKGERIAESWECSTHRNGRSCVRNGIYAGNTLQEVLKAQPALLGSRWRERCKNGELPILVKFLEAKENASVQVHPGDEYAYAHEDGALGKTEMWYVMDAREDARLIYGFTHDMEEERLRKSISDGTVDKYLQKIPVHRDDVFFIPPGCVHSVGAGILLAEIQENSDVTYRLYDFERTDATGKKRELHLEKALDVLDLRAGSTPRQPMRVLHYEPGCATEFLCRCRYFRVERMIISCEKDAAGIRIERDEGTFQILLCIQGGGRVNGCESSFDFGLIPGDCLFVPAGCETFALYGKMTVLRIQC